MGISRWRDAEGGCWRGRRVSSGYEAGFAAIPAIEAAMPDSDGNQHPPRFSCAFNRCLTGFCRVMMGVVSRGRP